MIKAENVLELYKLFFEKLNKHIALFKSAIENKSAAIENNEVDKTGIAQPDEALKKFIVDGLPVVVIGEASDFMEADEADKIVIASNAAYTIAFSHCDRVLDTSFIEAYYAALGKELYRQFLGMNQEKDYVTLVIKFIQKRHKSPSAQEMCDFLVNDVIVNRETEFSKFKQLEGLSLKDSNLIKLIEANLTELINELRSQIDKIKKPSNITKEVIEEIQKATFDFEIKAGKLIRSYQIKNESNCSWNPFLIHLLLLISGIGTILSIVSMVMKVITNKYGLFDSAVLYQPSLEEKAAEDQLLEGKFNK